MIKNRVVSSSGCCVGSPPGRGSIIIGPIIVVQKVSSNTLFCCTKYNNFSDRSRLKLIMPLYQQIIVAIPKYPKEGLVSLFRKHTKTIVDNGGVVRGIEVNKIDAISYIDVV